MCVEHVLCPCEDGPYTSELAPAELELAIRDTRCIRFELVLEFGVQGAGAWGSWSRLGSRFRAYLNL